MFKKELPYILFIILACFLSRVPLLLDSELILDGDECVVALMAKHTANGTGFPLFFYGQNYALSVFESLWIIPFYWIMGISTLAVKLAMLSFWTLGVIFFYLTLRQFDTKWKWLPLLIALLLISSPGWMTFSTRVLGGYITSFTLSCACLYLLFHRKYRDSAWSFLGVGLLAGVISQSQFLWLVGLSPVIFYRLVRIAKVKQATLFLLPFLSLFAVFHYYRQGLSRFHVSGRFDPRSVLVEYLLRIPKFIYCTMHGHHDLWVPSAPGLWSGTFAVVMVAIAILLPLLILIRVFRSGNFISLHSTVAISVVFSYVYCIFTFHIQGRYLLPLIAYLLFALFVFLADAPLRKWARASLLALLCIGVISSATFKAFSWPKTYPDALQKVLAELEKQGVHHVYCTHGMLTWQINFYSGENIIARPQKFPGRYEPYALKVDSVFGNGGKTAVVGYTDSTLNEYLYVGEFVEGNMFIYMNPAKEELSKEFEFSKGEIFPQY